MRRSNLIALFLVIGMITAFGFLTWRVKAKSVRLNVRDLREHGLVIIAPTDPSFNSEVAKLGVDRNEKQKQLMEVTKPFSVFVRNESSGDVIAYRIRWDVIQADGTVTTHLRTYAEPDALMGEDASRMSEAIRDAGVSIRAKTGRYVSLTSSIGQSKQAGIAASTGSSASSVGDASQIQQMGTERNETALTELLGIQLTQSESLTVTLDAAIFDDGTFIGPDSLNYFDQIQAEVAAKKQLLGDALFAAQQNRSLEQIFNDIESITIEPDPLIDENSTPSDYFKIYKKEFANEVLRIRAASGDDRKALWYATRPLFRRWPSLHKR